MNVFSGRDKQCEKCRAVFRFGQEHVCPLDEEVKKDVEEKEEGTDIDGAGEEGSTKKKKGKK